MFETLSNDDRGVSPVIGVILMVAITVILAAVIATFVLGLGDQIGNTNPTADFSFDYDSDNDDLTIAFSTGETIESQNVEITGTNEEDAWDKYTTIGAGDSVTITPTEDTVSVVWESGGQSATLADWQE